MTEPRPHAERDVSGVRIGPWSIEDYETHDEPPCPKCGSSPVVTICCSYSHDSGFSLYEWQCARCGAAWVAGGEEVTRPAWWDEEGTCFGRPTPYALLHGATPGRYALCGGDPVLIEEASDDD